ncbi:ABC transporter permease [Alloscardovia criceti]|uniref:ABC transporter permease n=1 Tax=Alloscardovia criceti TaxID=356828 RepID=UPI00037E451F|nr:ABC transporter permease [Alloscardovia criceti]
MTALRILVWRNTKLYFKDRGMFISSMMTPIILLVLYATFLKRVFENSFTAAFSAAGMTISDKLLNGLVGGQLVSSLLAVSCVTVAFCSNLLMIHDKVNGARKDLTMAPVRESTLSIAYYLSTLLSTLIVNGIALAVCLGYLATVGWYISASEVALLALDVFLLSMFGTAISCCINCLLSTDGQASAMGTLVSAGYGFVCGAYMPISSFSSGLQKALSFLPGTYGTSLVRNHAMGGAFRELASDGLPEEAVKAMRDAADCNLYFFGKQVQMGTMYTIMVVSIIVLILVYVVLSRCATLRKRR